MDTLKFRNEHTIDKVPLDCWGHDEVCLYKRGWGKTIPRKHVRLGVGDKMALVRPGVHRGSPYIIGYAAERREQMKESNPEAELIAREEYPRVVARAGVKLIEMKELPRNEEMYNVVASYLEMGMDSVIDHFLKSLHDPRMMNAVCIFAEKMSELAPRISSKVEEVFIRRIQRDFWRDDDMRVFAHRFARALFGKYRFERIINS